jgi:class 3 adenylate cyclase/predicted ATPase
MRCPQCGQENPTAARFCNDCGARLETACAGCGQANPPASRFCNGCGQPLRGAPLSPPAPGSYTPRHLAEKILTSKAALEGERKQVTVLFADLKGSMELLADRDPEDARKVLDPVIEHMMAAVHRYEGTVNQVMGDGIMALFGAPLAHEDHAVRACYAALRMQETVKRYAEEVRRTQGISLRIRIGLNSGDVVVRAVGSDLRVDYTAVGQTTHLAARMEQLADPGSTLLTPDTLALAEGHIEVRPLGPMPVKGLADPMEVYEMLGASTIRSRFQAAAARGLSRFVGRTVEIEQLHEALDHVRAGRGQVVGVVGEPGVGKSRLYHEFTLSHRVQGCFVLASVSVSYGKAAAYFPIIDLLRTYFRIEWRDDPRTIRERVTGRLLSLDRALELFLPSFLWLLDVPTDDPDWEHLDPPQRRRQILDGVKRLLLRESQAQPVVVIFEDLHWIDAETQALVDALVEGLPAARVLMLVNYRPEYQHAWGSKTYYRQLRIDPLPAASARELLDALLGDDATVQPLKGLLIQRTEGTPFFLEEGVRALVETRVLTGDRGSYRLLRSLDTIEVPATVKALLASRIDRLTPEDKSVLQAASVIGTDVPFDVLEAIAGVPRDELRRHLDQLQSAEFLYETALFPALEYTFKHALTHEVTYGSLLGDRRRALHARIVEAIERLYADRLGEQIERLAGHAVRGEIPDKAVTYLHEAGARALRRSANNQAVDYFTQALDLLARWPVGPEREGQELRLLLAFGPALQMTRGFGAPEVGRTYTRASELGEAIGQPAEHFQALWGRWLFTTSGGDYAEGRRIAEALIALGERLGDRALLLEAHHAMAPTTLWVGELESTRRHCEQGIALYDTEQHRSLAFLYGGHDPSVCCRMHAALALWMLGHPALALERSRSGLALARDLAHAGSIVNAFPFAVLVHQLVGDRVTLADLVESMVAMSNEYGLRQWLAYGRIFENWIRAGQDRGQDAIDQIRHAIDEYRAMGSTIWVPAFQGLLADVCLKHGATEEGLTTIAEALELADVTGAHLWTPEFHRLRGELLLARAGAEEAHAEAAFRQAIDGAREQGARSWELRAAVSLSRLWERRGKREEARRLVGEVHGWFTQGFDTADLAAARRRLDELTPP